MAVVTLDAGHGGYDNGASYQGRKEKDDNLNLALAVGNILQILNRNTVSTICILAASTLTIRWKNTGRTGADTFKIGRAHV